MYNRNKTPTHTHNTPKLVLCQASYYEGQINISSFHCKDTFQPVSSKNHNIENCAQKSEDQVSPIKLERSGEKNLKKVSAYQSSALTYLRKDARAVSG